MRIGEALYSKLSGTAGVTAIVGLRIYPMVLPALCEYPAVSFQKISDVPHHLMGSDSSLRSPRYQVDCWAETFSGVRALAEAVRAALQDATGTWGGAGGVVVQRAFLDMEIEFAENPGDATVYRVSQDYIIWYA